MASTRLVFRYRNGNFARWEVPSATRNQATNLSLREKLSGPCLKRHHYRSSDLVSSARCYLVTAHFGQGEIVVGFDSVISMPSGTLEHAWRSHRLVILPDFQGLGIGPRIGDAVAQLFVTGPTQFWLAQDFSKSEAQAERRPPSRDGGQPDLPQPRICWEPELTGSASGGANLVRSTCRLSRGRSAAQAGAIHLRHEGH